MKHIKYIGLSLFGIAMLMLALLFMYEHGIGHNVVDFSDLSRAFMSIGVIFSAGGLIGIWVTELIDYKKKKNKGEKDKDNKDKD